MRGSTVKRIVASTHPHRIRHSTDRHRNVQRVIQMQHAGLASVRQSDDVSQMQYGADVSNHSKAVVLTPNAHAGRAKVMQREPANPPRGSSGKVCKVCRILRCPPTLRASVGPSWSESQIDCDPDATALGESNCRVKLVRPAIRRVRRVARVCRPGRGHRSPGDGHLVDAHPEPGVIVERDRSCGSPDRLVVTRGGTCSARTHQRKRNRRFRRP